MSTPLPDQYRCDERHIRAVIVQKSARRRAYWRYVNVRCPLPLGHTGEHRDP